MTDAKLEKYSEVLNALVAESIACSPTSWQFGTLTVDCDGLAINYRLKSEADDNKARISGQLRLLCEELYVVMRQGGDTWTEAVINFLREDDAWHFIADFKYD